MVKPLSKIAWQFNKKLNILLLLHIPAFSLLCVYTKETQIYVHPKSCSIHSKLIHNTYVKGKR